MRTREEINGEIQKLPKTRKRRGILIAIAVIALSMSLMNGCGDKAAEDQKISDTNEVKPTVSEQADDESAINYDNFLKITMGSSYEDVVALLGEEGTQESSSEVAGIKTVLYSWDGPGISSMNITLQDDKIMTKAQMGLVDDIANITLEKYNQAQEGMSYKQVVDILGEGQILSQSEILGMDTTMYAWINKDGSNANLTFQGDVLQLKAQFNLK